jgi:hypothetical protein
MDIFNHEARLSEAISLNVLADDERREICLVSLYITRTGNLNP